MSDELREITETSNQALARWQRRALGAETRVVELEGELKGSRAEVERLNVPLHAPRPLKFIADDGDGEQLEFDTIEEARSCANEWIHVQRREAALTGEWSDVTEHIRILAEIERAHGEDVGEGVDFELEPTATDERKEGGA